MLISNLNYLESFAQESELQGGSYPYPNYPTYPCCYPQYNDPKSASALGFLKAYATGHETTTTGYVKMIADSEEGFSLTVIGGSASASN